MLFFINIFQKNINNFSFKTIKIFLYVFLILVLSEILMRYIEGSQLLFNFSYNFTNNNLFFNL